MKLLDRLRLFVAMLVCVIPTRKSKGMTPLINLFIGFAAIVVVLEVVILLAGVVTGLTMSMWTALNTSGQINGSWVVLMTNAVSVIQSAIQVGTLGILIYAFMAVLSAFGMFGAGGRR